MAIPLENKANVNPADSDFPFGDVRDKTISISGTKWDRQTMSDYIQFFHKMMDESGIPYNNQLDNEYSGFQFFDAFRALTRPYKTMSGVINQSGSAAPVITYYENTFGTVPVPSRTGAGTFKLTSTGLFSGSKKWIYIQSGSSVDQNVRASLTDDQFSFFNSVFDEGIPSNVLEDGMSNVSFEIRVYD